MKNLRLIFMFVMGLALMACTREEALPAEEDASGEYIVSLNFTGDIEVSQDPLTKATPTNDLYGINIYFDDEKDGVIDDVYGYGLFDNKEDMHIALLGGHKYRFVCSLAKNGRNTLFAGSGAFGNPSSGYAYPFQTGAAALVPTPTALGNRFELGDGVSLIGLATGAAHLKGTTAPKASVNSTNNPGGFYQYAPGVDRYYGEKTDYTPTIGGMVSIELKKVVFGARFVIEGIQDGELTASCGDLWAKTTRADDPGVVTLYSYPDLQDCWKNNPSLSMTVSLSFKGNGGGDLLKVNQNVTFKRNTLTIVTLQIPGGTFDITEEPLSGDNYIDLGLNEDGVIDTPVIPTPE
jgi:hypothetical protein